MADEETGDDGVEMTSLSRNAEDGSADGGVALDTGSTQVKRQNFCFGFGVLGCLAAAATIYFVAGVYASPSFTTGEMGVNEYDSGSGEVGIDAENAKVQELVDEEVEDPAGKKQHWRKKGNPMNWFTHGGRDQENPFGHLGTHHAGQGKEWVRNYSYWKEHPMDKDKLDKLREFIKSNRTKWEGGLPVPGENGMCKLANGREVPCPTKKQHSEDPQGTENNDAANSQQSGHTKITLKDGKKYEVLKQIQHDPKSFTQGLTYADGMLFESTGLYGKSKIRQLDPNTGEVLKSVDMPSKYFGEGMAYYDEKRLIQITWKSRKGFIYNSETLESIGEFEFSTTKNEGWGITFDSSDRTFIVSDGSSYLHFWDADKPGIEKKKVQVLRQNGQPATNMNELELVNGKVIANVWYQDVLLVIDPKTGNCEKEYDFSSLWPKAERRGARADVLNGVSVSGEEGVLFVTGKLWNRMYKIRLLGMDGVEENG